jgi:hypothetical protein
LRTQIDGDNGTDASKCVAHESDQGAVAQIRIFSALYFTPTFSTFPKEFY